MCVSSLAYIQKQGPYLGFTNLILELASKYNGILVSRYPHASTRVIRKYLCMSLLVFSKFSFQFFFIENDEHLADIGEHGFK